MLHNIRWTPQKIAQRLELIAPLVYRRSVPLRAFRYKSLSGPEAPTLAGIEVNDSSWATLAPGAFWGEAETDFVLRTVFRVPNDWDGESSVELVLPIGRAPDFIHPEALVYIDGQPQAAVDRFHHEVMLDPGWRDGQEHLLALRGFTGLWKIDQDGSGRPVQLHMGRCAVAQVHEPTRTFIARARVALETVQVLESDYPSRGHLLNALDRAFQQLDTREPLGEGFYASLPRASEILCEGIEEAGPAQPLTITATGHAHLDLAWLWTLGQTRRKAGRTFHTAMHLMEQFPDYHFTQSQPQLYEYVRQDYPALFEAIRERVAQGRWEPIGGMWVEADCNISGPESLARQFLLGQTYFREQFGDAAAPVLWLPDVFGYAWNLPQLIKQAGLDYFFTIKIGWSQYNRLPYDSFWWQGLDGSKVLTHFSTTPEAGDFPTHGTYNAVLGPRAALETWRNFRQKDVQQELLMSFGYGDGGGGPDRIMLENMRELANFPGMPRVRSGSVIDFFRRLEAESGEHLPTWNGELYLELHRGTYTSQSRNKRANRKSEFLLHDAEFLATLAAELGDYEYPHAELRRAWELICLNQFHDIIPGSSIHEVYVESLRQYDEVRQLGETVRGAAGRVLVEELGGTLLVINATSFARDDLVLWREALPTARRLQHADGVPVRAQVVADGTLLDVGTLPPYSVTPLAPGPATDETPAKPLVASPELLENDYIRVELDEAGDVSHIFDKRRQREVIAPGAVANQFQAFEDRPLNWDAWDVDIFYDDRMWLAQPAEAIRVVEQGPLRATIEVRRRILNSSYVQRLSLCHDRPELRFETTIDWRERHTMLKVAFPVNILSPSATYEIQWGNVERPTHRNTSWDWARFETCAQKWVDLSEGDYGVSLLNDCKYGHDIWENRMRLTLLRSPTYPDPEADQGEHHFVYSLFPHEGPWGEETIRAAYALNDPLHVVEGRDTHGEPASPTTLSLIAVDAPNVVVETVKQAEDGQGIIVRLYEAMRRRGPVRLKTPFSLQAAYVTNLLEEPEQELAVEGDEVLFNVSPYQIRTLRLIPAESRLS